MMILLFVILPFFFGLSCLGFKSTSVRGIMILGAIAHMALTISTFFFNFEQF